MRFKIARVNLLVGVQLLEPFILLPKRMPEMFDALYRALSPRHVVLMTDLVSSGGSSFNDLKVTVNVFNGRGRIDVTPTGFVADLRELAQTSEDFKALRDFLVTCEQAVIAGVKTEEKASTELLQRDFRAHLWIDCVEGKEAAEAWLRGRGEQAVQLKAGEYPEMRREFTFQVQLVDEKGRGRIGVGVQKSQVALGHLYLACEHQSFRTNEGLGAMDANFDKAYAELEGLLRSIGLEPARDDA